jgi:hypothetical protein
MAVPNSLCPDPFKGTDKEDATIWLNRFNMYAELKSWSSEQTAKTFPLFLREDASVWYETLATEQKSSFDTLQKAFKDRFFPHKSLRWARLDQFGRRTQQDGESAISYAQDVVRLGRQLEKTDSAITERIVQGLRPALRKYVMDKDPHTVEDTLTYARMAEAYNADNESSLSSLTDEIKDLKVQLSHQLAALQASAAAPVQQPRFTHNPHAGYRFQRKPQTTFRPP